jgi:DNA-binding transcriptional LysR family regulator
MADRLKKRPIYCCFGYDILCLSQNEDAMELRHLRYFLTVAEELHFGRAAERLFICQPPLSQQIQQLERELGVRLFFRTNRRVQLTPAGTAFREHAQRILEQTSEAARAAQRADRGETGRLIVGFAGSAAYTGLPQSIQRFRRNYPDVELSLRELRTPQQVEALLGDRLDVGVVRSADLGHERLCQRVLLRESWVIALPKKHPLARRVKLPLASLANEDFVLYPQEVGPGMYNQVVSLCQRAGFTPRPAQQATQITTIISLVAAGLGVALAPASVQSMRWPGVVYRSLADAAPRIALTLAWRRDLQSPVVEAFVECIAREMIQHP